MREDNKKITKKEFFEWCEDRNLYNSRTIASVFNVSSQTIRNWKKKADDDYMPQWVFYACKGFDVINNSKNAPFFPPITIAWFSGWQSRHSLKTYADTAQIFDIKRQAVHNWFKRGRLPKWLILSCLGYDAFVKERELPA